MKTLHLTADALRHHAELFPHRQSTLQTTDPEFIALFDNWAFDEVLRQSKLETRARLRLILAATIATHAIGEYRVMVGAALTVGVTPVEIKEILYQSVSYVGIARALDFLHATNDELRQHGVGLPVACQSTTTPATRVELGLAAQRAIFGGAIDTMRRQAPADEAHIHAFLAANCFGDIYTRTGLDLKTRELLTFVLLISLGGCEPQVRAHITANLRMGNDRACLIDAVTQLLPYIGYPRALNALRAIDEIVPLREPTVDADARADS